MIQYQSPKSRTGLLLLSLFGADRLYAGCIKTGILKLVLMLLVQLFWPIFAFLSTQPAQEGVIVLYTALVLIYYGWWFADLLRVLYLVLFASGQVNGYRAKIFCLDRSIPWSRTSLDKWVSLFIAMALIGMGVLLFAATVTVASMFATPP